MRQTLQSSWPLFLGLTLLMIGSGLQGTLLGVRATIEGFGTTTTGMIMSLYYAGYVAGSVFGPRLVSAVGHIRVFAAMASLASITSLLHGMFVDPIFWGLIRILTGFSFAALYIVVESWMNDIATKKNRGKILALYLLTFYGAMMAGQYLLNFAAPETIELFVLASVLVSIALLPISLSTRPAPDFQAPVRLKIPELYRISPLGVGAVAMSGMGTGIFFTIAPVYAMNAGMAIAGLAVFMMVFNLGGALFQLPLGALSDRFGRRMIIILVAAATALLSLACFALADTPLYLYIALLLFGGFSLSIYPIAAAYTNDHLEREQYVSASASLILIGGAASFLGPMSAALVMSLFGNDAFFPLLAGLYLIIALFAAYRTTQAEALPVDEQVNFVNLPPRASFVSTQIIEDDIDAVPPPALQTPRSPNDQ